MRRALELPGDHAPHLRELAHQVVLRVQPPGRVDDHHVDAPRARLRDRVEGHRAGVRARGARHDLAARPLRPALELLAGRRPERVRAGQQHAAPQLLAQVPRELADRRRLARAVDAHRHDHRRPGPDVDPRVADPRGRRQQLDQALAERLAALELPRGRLLLERLHDRCGRARADVGHDQRLLQAFPRLLVEHAEQRRLDLRAERLAGLGHALAQAAEQPASLAPFPPAGAVRLLDALRAAGAIVLAGYEQFAPVAGHGARDDSSGSELWACGQARSACGVCRQAVSALRRPRPPRRPRAAGPPRTAGAARAPWRPRRGPSTRRTASRPPPSCASDG